MKWVFTVIIISLIVVGHLGASLAYDFLRPAPIWDTMRDFDYFVNSCKNSCMSCFKREVGEPAPDLDTIVDRCKRFNLRVIKHSILKL